MILQSHFHLEKLSQRVSKQCLWRSIREKQKSEFYSPVKSLFILSGVLIVATAGKHHNVIGFYKKPFFFRSCHSPLWIALVRKVEGWKAWSLHCSTVIQGPRLSSSVINNMGLPRTSNTPTQANGWGKRRKGISASDT